MSLPSQQINSNFPHPYWIFKEIGNTLFVTKVVKKAFCLSILTIWLTTALHAEVTNAFDVHENIEPCSAYLDFLDLKKNNQNLNIDDCHELTHFLIESDTDKIKPFFDDLQAFAGRNSSLGALADVAWSVLRQEPVKTYMFTELAGLRISVSMMKAGDLERAAFYSYLLTDIQIASVIGMCDADFSCQDISKISTVSSLLGEEFSNLDQARSDKIFLCLLKSDSFQLALRDVLQSPKFSQCIFDLGGI